MKRFLTSTEVASMLRLHVVTVRQMANNRIIPAGKAGDDWRFLEEDIVDYIRGQYKVAKCHSTSSPAPRIGLPASRSQVSLGYADRLAQRIAKKRSASTTSGGHKHGH